MKLLPAIVICCCGCLAGGEVPVDVDPPRLLGTDIPPALAISPTSPVELRFSEPIDPASLQDHAVVIVPWRLGSRCSVALACADGDRCHGGRCQHELVDEAWLKDLANPPLADRRLGEIAESRLELAAGGERLAVAPLRPLAPHRLHTLVATSSLTDRAGNPLLAGPAGGVRTFVTAGIEDAQPQLTLVSPVDGSTDLPTNLDRIVALFTKPIDGLDPAALWLESEGERIGLSVETGADACGATEPNRCFLLRPHRSLAPLTEWQLRAGGAVHDDRGRPVFPRGWPRFASGVGADQRPPRVVARSLVLSDRCLLVSARSDEATDLQLSTSWSAGVAARSTDERSHLLAVPAPTADGAVALLVSDLAGNKAAKIIEPIAAALPPAVVITEVLANPAGAEPAQEYVELFNRSTATVELDGWVLDDEDDGAGAGVLPSVRLPPARYALVVGKGYDLLAGEDPPPEPGTIIVRLERTLGAFGLANSGERIVLRTPEGLLASSYGGHLSSASDADDGRSVERIDPAACDVPSSWIYNRAGSSSPGRGPDSTP